MAKQTRILCDVCKTELIWSTHIKNLSVVFTSNQNDGKGCDPYISNVDVDICPLCMPKLLKGNMLFAYGAMGFNDYYFKPEVKNEK